MEFSASDNEASPVPASFSLSVRDGANEVECSHNVLTELLLMSEIKGYVRNPSCYFEWKNDSAETRRTTSLLDQLLMVQGWRRYSWKRMSGVEPFELTYRAEQGIETRGKVVTLVRQKPKPNVDVALTLHKKIENEEHGAVQTFVTDSLGRFFFISGVEGRWNMILSVSEKGRKKDHLILLDRVFSPEPKRYRYADLQVSIAEKNTVPKTDEETSDDLKDDLEASKSFFAAYQDSLYKAGVAEKVYQLSDVTIKAKKIRTKEQDIYRNRSTSVACYDVASEMDDIYDKGKYIGDDIHELLKTMNQNFSTVQGIDREWILYKRKMPLIIINHERMTDHNTDIFKYKDIRVQAIKSIYINETTSARCQYADPRIRCTDADDMFSCVVFIETYPEGQIPVEDAKGVRYTWLEGYSTVSEFYSPDYSALPPEPDYRRTLYWNPSVTADENGRAKIQFYNNSNCKNFSISAETVTAEGLIGIYKNE